MTRPTSSRFAVAATAKRLTAAQARAVFRGSIGDEQPTTINFLLAELLFYREPTIGTTCYSLQLTRFGLAVQAELRASGRFDRFGDPVR